MKNPPFILLFTISAGSPDNNYDLLKKQFTSPVPLESVHSESVPSVKQIKLIYFTQWL